MITNGAPACGNLGTSERGATVVHKTPSPLPFYFID
jgi:hypothetical protein